MATETVTLRAKSNSNTLQGINRMAADDKATRINLLEFQTPQMRAFHVTWFAFFCCFFAWFGVAPLMAVVRDELKLTKDQIGWCIIGSVSITIFTRILMGWLCDRIGPRLTYTGLLLIGSIPVMAIGLSHDFTSFLMFRIAIGIIGGSFVITQFHTSMMFAPNCVGTANATVAGWGNLGGGVTQIVMPLVFAALMGTCGISSAAAWRTSMFLAGLMCAIVGIAYYFLTQDTPAGNLIDLRRRGVLTAKASIKGTLLDAGRDSRVWALFAAYACSFGIELTLDNIAALYFVDYFGELKSLDTLESVRIAGLVAGLFGGMNIFARTLGGYVGDRLGARWGLSGRVKWLFIVLFFEGIALALFSQARTLWSGIPLLMVLGMFVKMSNGATYSVVPFVNRRALGSVSGIVGAGGNFGAVAAGFLFKTSAISWSASLLILGVIVSCASFVVLSIKLTDEQTAAADEAQPLLLPPLELGYSKIGAV